MTWHRTTRDRLAQGADWETISQGTYEAAVATKYRIDDNVVQVDKNTFYVKTASTVPYFARSTQGNL